MANGMDRERNVIEGGDGLTHGAVFRIVQQTQDVSKPAREMRFENRVSQFSGARGKGRGKSVRF